MDSLTVISSPHAGMNRAEIAARNASESIKRNSKVFSMKYEEALPKIKKSELHIGSFLGRGAFSNVHEITAFSLEENTGSSENNQSSRLFLKTHVLRETTGDCRYAVKFLRKEVTDDPDQYLEGAVDYVIETKLLCSLIHPNIVKLRGLSVSGESGFSTGESLGYFLILDRLYDTLKNRIVTWKSQRNKCEKMFSRFGSKNKGEKHIQILCEKFQIAFDIAGAFKYLHSKNIVYRDLKPENLGFDVRGDIKLFDFGLAKEISFQQRLPDGTFHLSGRTGSLRYMAPEVAQCKPYNITVDSYSFSVLLWHMLSLKTPFKGYNEAVHARKVVNGTTRPKISDSWPSSIRHLLESGWSRNSTERPSFDEMYSTLKREIMSIRNVNTRELSHSRRRSTHVMFRESVIRKVRGTESS